MPPALIVGNWKMNGLTADLAQARALASGLGTQPTKARIGLCPPATLIAQMVDALQGSSVLVGGQDCHGQAAGAFTGDISAVMLADAGASLVIAGHSERRAAYAETDAIVAAKAAAAAAAGLEPILCVGESLAQREAGQALSVVTDQVKGSVGEGLAKAAFAVAYEPIWAIGSGLTPSLAEIEAVHAAIREALIQAVGPSGAAVPILYGGSVKPSNAADILALADVGGALVGGASLKAADFLDIIAAAS